MDIERVKRDIRTWEKRLFLDYSPPTLITFV
jgi:hypothetical protein